MQQLKVTLLHADEKFHNQPLNVPIDGLIQLVNGEVDVTPACAACLLTIPEWTLKEQADTEGEEDKTGLEAGATDDEETETVEPENSVKDAAAVIGKADEETDENQGVKLQLQVSDEEWDTMTLEQLKETATLLPDAKWKAFASKEKSLRSYLKNRFKTLTAK